MGYMKPIQFASPESEPPVDGAGASTEQSPHAEGIKAEILHGALGIIAEQLHGKKLDLYEAKIRAFESKHAMLPEGKIQDAFSRLRPLAEVDAKVTQDIDRAKDFTFGIIKHVLAKEAPAVGLIPDGIMETTDAAAVYASTWMLEQYVDSFKRGLSIARNAVHTVADKADSVMNWFKGAAPVPAKAVIS